MSQLCSDIIDRLVDGRVVGNSMELFLNSYEQQTGKILNLKGKVNLKAAIIGHTCMNLAWSDDCLTFHMHRQG